MPIFKIHNQTRYASIPNATLRDKRLSIESRGVLAYLLTHDDKFELSFVFLQKELGIGRDKLKNIVRELKQSGYLCLVAAHNKKGSFDGQEWFVFAVSQDADFTVQTFDRLTEKPSDVKTVRRENRQTENPSDNKEENSSQKKILGKEENIQREIPREDLSDDFAEAQNELEENLFWVQRQTGLKSKRNFPETEWAQIIVDVASEGICGKGFQEFYEWVKNLNWVETVSPKLLRGQIEKYLKRDELAKKKQNGANENGNNPKFTTKRTNAEIIAGRDFSQTDFPEPYCPKSERNY